MKKLLLALLLFGCAEADQSSTWSVELNGGIEPSCVGDMSLTMSPEPNGVRTFSGEWKCGELGGAVADGRIATNGTTVTKLGDSRFYGVMVNEHTIAGFALFYGGELPFIASRR